jgi:hypothetical protein
MKWNPFRVRFWNLEMRRVRRFRTDDRGQVLLLTAIMVFLVTVFGLLAFDTNVAIYNRITAQNAVDAAADSAALWQARGCNIVQNLNNMHYLVNKVCAWGEGIAAVSCAGGYWPPAVPVACPICATLPIFDAAQQAFSLAVTNIQAGVITLTPFLAFLNANACAKGSGASPLLKVASDALEALLGRLGVDLTLGSGLVGQIGSVLATALGDIPIYAAPLDPTSLGLYVDLKEGESYPWTFTAAVGVAGGGVAASNLCGPFFAAAYEAMRMGGWDGNWGWNDAYFEGNPGFMTWIAGRESQDEILGLGKLRWINGQSRSLDEIKVLYSGPSFPAGGAQEVPGFIPGFLAVASSQVEGTPVIDHGSADAKGKLIKVYFPQTPITPEFPGESIGILH